MRRIKYQPGYRAVVRAAAIGCAGLTAALINSTALSQLVSIGDGSQIANATNDQNSDGSGWNAVAGSIPYGSDAYNPNAGAQADGGNAYSATAAEPGGSASASGLAFSNSTVDAGAEVTAQGGWGSTSATSDGGNGGNADIQVSSILAMSITPPPAPYYPYVYGSSLPGEPYIDATFSAQGGTGGDSWNQNAGNGGSATVDNPIVIESEGGGPINATLTATGGSGGSSGEFAEPQQLQSSAIPSSGQGQAEFLTNEINAVGEGMNVQLTQSATGGNGGPNAYANGLPGAAAGSALNYSSIETGGSSFTATTNATGGFGGGGGGGYDSSGNVILANGAAGGAAGAQTELSPTSSSDLTACNAYANATGGLGGSGENAGAGGNATAVATASNPGGAGVPDYANASATGGSGGRGDTSPDGGDGGGGGGATATAEALPWTGAATAIAVAVAGNGGEGHAGGIGGSATATAEGIGIFGDESLSASATGGSGGYEGDETYADGGSATAIITDPEIGSIEMYSPGLANGTNSTASVSVGMGTLSIATSTQTVYGTLSITVPGTLTLNNGPSDYSLVIGDGTDATTFQLSTTSGNTTSLGTFDVNTNSSLDIFTDPTSTTTFQSGNINNGTVLVTGTGSNTIGSVTGTGALIIGDGTNATTLQLNTTDSSTTTQGSFTVNANSRLNLFTDSTSSTTFSTGNTNNGTLDVTGTGSVAIGGLNGSGSLIVGDGTNPTLLQLSHESGASSVGSLTINSGSKLDITNNHLFIDYGSGSDPMSTIYSYLKSGYNNGHWNGPGIISSTAQSPTSGHYYGIGFSDGKDNVVSGLSSGQIELKYTLLGDANLDGNVNGTDFSIVSADFGTGDTNWDQGNFLYTSSVNGSDFSALSANFGNGDSGADVSVTKADIAALDAFAMANNLPIPTIGAVPEPGTAVLFGGSVLGLLSRRRKRVGLVSRELPG